MGCKRISFGRLVGGIAVGALALTPLAAPADQGAGGGAGMSGGGGMGGDTMMSATPTQVTGTVLRYYVDRSGYVTAMDIQTAEGVRFVRFSPGMGQRLYSTYPVGGQASVWVVGDTATGGGRWDVVGMGTSAPMGGGVTPYRVTDVDLLEAEPYVMVGQKQVMRHGLLRGVITNDEGEVVGLVLDNNTLVRVTRHFRHIAPGHAGTERVAQLFRRADVWVTGYPEAPRYGAMSTFGERIIATSLTINGHNVGAIGIPMMMARRGNALLDWNFAAGSQGAEEMRARQMGYEVYSPGAPGTTGAEGAMTAPEGTMR